MTDGVLVPAGTTLTVTPSPAKDLPWIEGTWSGRRQLRCKLCPWDTLGGEGPMIEHIQTRHGGTAPQPRLVQAYDARGNPLP